MNSAISHAQQRLQDETLCSVLILNILDDVTGQKSFAAGTHLTGCAQLLKLREDQDFWTSCTQDLAHSIVIQTQAQVVRNYQPDHESSKGWLCNQTFERPAALIYEWCLEIGRLSKTASRSLQSNGDPESGLGTALLAVIQKARQLDSLGVNWYMRGGSRWSYQTIYLYSSSEHLTTVDYYSDVQVAKVWNQYRSARIILHEIVVAATQCLQKFDSSRENDYLVATERKSLSIITSMLSGICQSIPFHLQKIDSSGRQCSPQSQRVLGGCALIWPLETVLRCRWREAHHRDQVTGALNEIGYVVGVRQALVSLAQVPEDDMTVADGCANAASNRVREFVIENESENAVR